MAVFLQPAVCYNWCQQLGFCIFESSYFSPARSYSLFECLLSSFFTSATQSRWCRLHSVRFVTYKTLFASVFVVWYVCVHGDGFRLIFCLWRWRRGKSWSFSPFFFRIFENVWNPNSVWELFKGNYSSLNESLIALCPISLCYNWGMLLPLPSQFIHLIVQLNFLEMLADDWDHPCKCFWGLNQAWNLK